MFKQGNPFSHRTGINGGPAGFLQPWRIQTLKGTGGGLDLLALLAFLPSVISYYLPKIRGKATPPPPQPGPSP